MRKQPLLIDVQQSLKLNLLQVFVSKEDYLYRIRKYEIKKKSIEIHEKILYNFVEYLLNDQGEKESIHNLFSNIASL